MENGTRSLNHIHVTGDVNSETAFITEGGLKGDVASFYDNDALFICLAGINATGSLKETVEALNVKKAVIAVDMDKLINERVHNGVERIVRVIMSVRGIETEFLNWDPRFKGVDDYYQARAGLWKAVA
jgi:hypothetical protein